MKFYQKSIDDVLTALGASREGLSSAEVEKRLAADGPNQIKVKGQPLWKLIIAPFASVMVLVLVIAGLISLWQKELVDAIIIFAIIMISAVIDWVQQYSTERILRSLRQVDIDSSEVYRDGEVVNIKIEDLVRGDIIVLHEGQKIPADARMIESDNLHVDESMLTGESLSVKKIVKPIVGDKEVYDQANMLFSGSFVVTGAGIAVVTNTGNDTEFGKLAKLAGEVNTKSPVQEKVDSLIKKIVTAVFAMAILALVLQLARGVELVEALRFVLAFAVSAVPEGLPIAIAVVLALGMRRMAAKKALVRNMRAIENVGLVTTIATDKTGTLTRNELRVQEVWSPRLNDATLALQMSFALNLTKGRSGDPLDAALVLYMQKNKVRPPHQTTQAELVRTFPFDYKFAMSGNNWRFGKNFKIYIKGAPEKILERCELSAAVEKQILAQLHEFAKSGFRVIALANLSSSRSIEKLADLPGRGLEFLGLLAIADDLRPRVASAVDRATRAGIRVRMITGDHAETAYHIAKKIDIADDPSQVYNSRRLMKLKPAQLTEIVEATRVYARVTPEAKHTILTELNKTEITAMTGDGVNDVPALSRAHVGIAMGSGAAIAKDAGDIVLLDNNFRSIITAVKEGRIIIANVRRMLIYLVATNAGEVLVTIGALLIGLPLPVLAVQILWINLATDTFMVIPLGLEPGDKSIMKHPPARIDSPILSRFMLSRIVTTALMMAGLTLGVFALFLNLHSEAEARSATFLVLIVIQWVNAISMRGELPIHRMFEVKNRAFWFALSGAVLLQLIVMFTPIRSVLHLEMIHADSIWACLVAAAVMILTLEIHKYIGRRYRLI